LEKLATGAIDRHPRHQDHHGLAVLALLGPGDELVAPAHDLADVRKAEELELADDLLDRHLGALSPGVPNRRAAAAPATSSPWPLALLFDEDFVAAPADFG
jgi:hypothetical protein